MKSLLYTLKCLPLFALLLFSANLSAQASLSVQGVLTKSDGTAVDDGTYTITFRLWKSPTSVAPADKVHEEPINVETTGGVYSVVLGQNPQYPLSAPFDQIYYLGVNFGSSELLPRPQLTHAPYALSLLGQSNIFPSTGTVLADALQVGAVRAAAGPPTVNVAGRGYSFNGGDADGGLFSTQDNRVALYANATEKVRVSSGLIELFGDVNTNKLTVFGPLTSNDHTVNGSTTITNQLTVNNGIYSPGRIRINGGAPNQNSGGITFNYPNVIDDTDSGLFGTGDGQVSVYSNGERVALFLWNGGYNPSTDQQTSSVRFWGIQKGPNSPQVEWDPNTGELQVDNSSRRLKRNIRPMDVDFTAILKVEPKFYNRIGYPDSLVEAGYIAEEFDSLGLWPLVHYYNGGEIFGISYDRVAMYLTEVVKMHHAELDKMKSELDGLRAEVETLRAENAGLRTENNAAQAQQTAANARLDALAQRLSALEAATASHR